MQSQLSTPNELVSVVIHPHVLITLSEYSLIRSEGNRGIDLPSEKAISKAFVFQSEEPEFPTSMLFGLCLGFAFGGGCEYFIGVRESGTLLAVQRAKSLYQGL